jgi:hypothetical protein
MRSRTLGVELINQRAPQMGVSVPHLTAHKDSYLSSDFDIVISSLGNAFYETVTALTAKVKSFISSLFGGIVI